MRPRILLVVAFTLALVAVMGGVAYAETAADNAQCLTCHGANGVGAVSKVDFGVGPVDKSTACNKCHWISPHPPHHTYEQCIDCHGSWDAQPRTKFYTAAVSTPYGYFSSVLSPDTGAATIHAIHTQGSWPASATGFAPVCTSCHSAAACDACHSDPAAHGPHAVSSATIEPGAEPINTRVSAGSPVGLKDRIDRSYYTTSTCGAYACHGGAATHERITYDSPDVAYTGLWYTESLNVYTIDLAATMQTSFTGTSFTYIAQRSPVGGIARLYVDDVLVRTLDFYGPSFDLLIYADVTGLASGTHTVRLEQTGTKYSGSLGYLMAFAYLDARTEATVAFTALPACTNCHDTYSQHYGGATGTRHTSVSLTCGGTGCHATPDLATVHAERNAAFGCEGCHNSVRSEVQNAIVNHLTGCGDCHGSISALGGHRSAHAAVPPLANDDGTPNYSYTTGSAGTAPTRDCTGCHTSNLVDEHMGLVLDSTVFFPRYDASGNPLTCGTCHDQPVGSAVQDAIAAGSSACETCHAVHAPIPAVHTSTFVDTPDLACAECHSANLAEEHDGTYTSTAGLTGCDVCHALYSGKTSGAVTGDAAQAAISPGNDTRCSACHAVYHANSTAHKASSTASLQCGSCHAVGQTVIDVTALHPTCATCHSSSRIGEISGHTAECASCHSAEGTDYHTTMSVHLAPASSGCQVSGCHHSQADVRDVHASCATCHADASDSGKTTACANCHGTVEGTDYHTSFAIDHTPTDTYSQDCAGCHDTTDVRALHATNGCNTCHYISGCTDCHSSHDAMGVGLTKTTSCSTCHASEGTDYHSGMSTGHTYSAMPTSCTTGSPCHVANTLPEEHARFIAKYAYASTCDLCHKNTDPARIPVGATADCSSCHTVHGDIATIHTATQSQSCVDCHETGDVRELHGISADASCAVCHEAAAGRIDWATATIECGSCHAKMPLDTAHYPAASHGAVAETGCNQCHYMDMKAEHFKSTVGVTCVQCHEVKVDSFTQPWDKTCAACHPTKHGEQQIKHASTSTTCSGVGCHDITDVAALHGKPTGPGCGACHVNPTTPATTTDCTASGCHANVGINHHEAHNAASVAGTGCSSCHFMYLDDEHAALGYTCAACHSSTVSAVVAAIAASDVRCTSCHPGAHSALQFEFNPLRASVHRVSGDLPGMRSTFYVAGTKYTWTLPTASTFLKSGWTADSMMSCADCHSYSGATGPHGATMKVNIDSAYPNPYKVTTGSSSSTAQLSPNSPTGMSMSKSGSAAAGIICEKCHDLYNGGWSNVAHKEHDDRGIEGAYCNQCHVTTPHGWSRPRLIGYTTDPAPYNTYKGGVQRISLKSYTPSSWGKSDCGAACSSERHPLSGTSWPAADAVAPATGSITGTVKTSTGSAITGATVTVGTKTATTTSSGYSIADVAPGAYTMTVAASGYISWSGTVTIVAGETATQNVTLAPIAPTATNIARTGTASASSTDSYSYAASGAIDGDAGTHWRSASGGTQWLRVDFGSAKTFDKVVVSWYSTRYARSYRIQTSTDGSNWTDRFSTTSGNGGSDVITFASVSARYVRVYCTYANDNDYRITEFEVWGY